MMQLDPARWAEIRRVFDEVVELTPEQREIRMHAVSESDPSLHQEVERLLAADAVADVGLASLDAALRPRDVDPPARLTGTADLLGLVGRMVSHFRVIDPIAAGGMGVVYRAEDTRLQRVVALKLPLPQYCADEVSRERFLREARAAGALDHPNVCGVYEAGESETGQVYLAMPLYAGETLRARLQRDGALSVDAAVNIARAVARGLGAAHTAGIIHRDVKPGNIMLLPDGNVKVLDFGLARLRDADVSASSTTAGTVAYSAPEQIRGERLDARVDLWALGVVLYEMLTGKRPFDGSHDASIAYAIVHQHPRRAADVPKSINAAVCALLEKDPARRPATAAQVDAELDAAMQGHKPRREWRTEHWSQWRWRVAALLAGAVLVVVAASSRIVPLLRPAGRRPAHAVSPPPPNVDAYAFYLRGRDYERRVRSRENLESARALYQRALTLDSTFALARARGSIVLSTMLSSAYEVPASTLAEARHASEAALRSQPSLGDGYLALGHVFMLERKPDSALAAYERAAAIIPDSAEVHTAIAVALRGQGRWEEALARFERAARLDPRNPTLLQSLARTQSRLRHYEGAIRTWDRILALAPDDHDAKVIRGMLYLRWLGTTDTLREALRSLPPEWDPEGTASWARFFVALIERRPADALAVVTPMRHGAAQDDLFFRPRALMQAQAYEALGDRQRARAHFEAAHIALAESVAVHPRSPRMHAALGLACAGLGKRTEAISEARRAMEIAGAPAETPTATAMMGEAAEIHARAGDADGALALIQRLLDMPAGREVSVPLLRVDPVWDPLRSNPRFEALLQRYSSR